MRYVPWDLCCWQNIMHDDIMHGGPKLISEDEICTLGFMLMTKYYASWHNAWWNMMHWYIAISLHRKLNKKYHYDQQYLLLG